MIWKKIKNFENYSINEKGEVRNDTTNLIKKATLNRHNGYYYIDLYNGKKCKMSIHRLVALAFIPNPENKPTVDHIDANRTNNTISNLRWATYKEQNERISKIGVRSEPIKVTKYHENRKKRGGGHVSWGDEIEVIKFNRITDVAKYFNVTIGNISLLLKNGTIGKRGVTRGYKFEYMKSNHNRNV